MLDSLPSIICVMIILNFERVSSFKDKNLCGRATQITTKFWHMNQEKNLNYNERLIEDHIVLNSNLVVLVCKILTHNIMEFWLN